MSYLQPTVMIDLREYEALKKKRDLIDYVQEAGANAKNEEEFVRNIEQNQFEFKVAGEIKKVKLQIVQSLISVPAIVR